MRNKALVVVAGLLLYYACTQSAEKLHEEKQAEAGVSAFDEYKASPLAALMRQMDNEMRVLRESVLRGDAEIPSGFRFEYEALHTATPTDSAAITLAYHEMADEFLEAVARFRQEAPGEEAYNLIIESCLVCHRQLCPGPVQRIQKLQVP